MDVQKSQRIPPRRVSSVQVLGFSGTLEERTGRYVRRFAIFEPKARGQLMLFLVCWYELWLIEKADCLIVRN